VVLRRGLDKTELVVCFTCLTESLESRKRGSKKKKRKKLDYFTNTETNYIMICYLKHMPFQKPLKSEEVTF